MKPSSSANAESNREPLSLNINGEVVHAAVDPEMPLLWFLRDRLDLKGTKYGCGTGYCGACLVLIDGETNHACMVSLGRVGERAVTTIEGLAHNGAQPIIDAWVTEQVPQCGYCHSGQLMAAAALVADPPNPSDADIDRAMSGIICRCGTYDRIRRAIHRAAQEV